MGGIARRAILFEGPPGTGKTYLAKAMAAEAGVPFLFVSSSAFQSMFYGQTNRKIRSYFRALRKYARREGGAIGFIEEIDAIGGARGRHGQRPPPRRRRRRRQRAADPAPVLRPAPAVGPAARCASSTSSTTGCRRSHQLAQAADAAGQHPRHRGHQPGRRPRPGPAAARAASTAPSTSTCRSKSGRREIIDYYLAKKAHDAELDDPAKRDTLAGDDLRLLAGDDRAPARRGARLGAAPRRRPASAGTTSSRPR